MFTDGIKTIVPISKQKTFQEAINLYRLKSGNNDKNLKFFLNGEILNPELKIFEAKLKDCSHIYVEETGILKGG